MHLRIHVLEKRLRSVVTGAFLSTVVGVGRCCAHQLCVETRCVSETVMGMSATAECLTDIHDDGQGTLSRDGSFVGDTAERFHSDGGCVTFARNAVS